MNDMSNYSTIMEKMGNIMNMYIMEKNMNIFGMIQKQG